MESIAGVFRDSLHGSVPSGEPYTGSDLDHVARNIGEDFSAALGEFELERQGLEDVDRNQFQFVIYLRFLCITLLDSICIGNVSCRMQIIDVNRNFSLKCKKIRKHCFADLVLQL